MNTTPSDGSWWALTCNKMENNGNIYQLKGNALLLSNSHHSLEAPITVSKKDNNSSFVNHALTLLTERGQKYVGSQWHSWPEELGEPAIRLAGAQMMRSCLSPAEPSHILLLYLICLHKNLKTMVEIHVHK